MIRGDRTEQDCPHLIRLPEWNSHGLLQTQLELPCYTYVFLQKSWNSLEQKHQNKCQDIGLRVLGWRENLPMRLSGQERTLVLHQRVEVCECVCVCVCVCVRGECTCQIRAALTDCDTPRSRENVHNVTSSLPVIAASFTGYDFHKILKSFDFTSVFGR